MRANAPETETSLEYIIFIIWDRKVGACSNIIITGTQFTNQQTVCPGFLSIVYQLYTIKLFSSLYTPHTLILYVLEEYFFLSLYFKVSSRIII